MCTQTNYGFRRLSISASKTQNSKSCSFMLETCSSLRATAAKPQLDDSDLNVYANELRLQEIEHIGVEDSELEKLLVHAGDLLIVEGNGSKTQIGRLAMWDGSIHPCVVGKQITK